MGDGVHSGDRHDGKWPEAPRGAVRLHPAAAGVMEPGDVYFVLAKTSGLIKIGYAKCAEHRLSSLQVGCPEELALIGIIATYLPSELERDLHERFKCDRVRGEWFRCTDEIVAYISAHAREAWAD